MSMCFLDSFVDIVESLALLRLPNDFDEMVVELGFDNLVVISVVEQNKLVLNFCWLYFYDVFC